MNNKQDFTNYKELFNGPNALGGKTRDGVIGIRTRAGSCDNWNRNEENLVSLNIREHDLRVDAYAFVILDMVNNLSFTVGWIFFDELIEKAEAIFEDDTIYLTIPIKSLRSPEELTNFLKGKERK